MDQPTDAAQVGVSSAPDIAVVTERLAALDRLVHSELRSMKELHQSERDGDQQAVKLALDQQRELAQKHNDLIRQQERKDDTYSTKAEVDRIAGWQNKMAGGLVAFAFIGIANLVKVWFG